MPRTLGIIDNARRLRNRIVHDNGLFKESYEKDTIKDPEGRELFEVQTHPGYYIFEKNTKTNIPIILTPEYVFSWPALWLAFVDCLALSVPMLPVSS